MGGFEALGRAAPALVNFAGNLQTMDLRDEQEKRQALVFNYGMRELQRKEQDLAQPVPIDLIQKQFSNMPQAGQHLLDFMDKSGMVQDLNGMKVVTARDLDRTKGIFDTNAKLGQTFLAKMGQDASAKYQTVNAQFSDAQAKGNTKEMERLAPLVKQAEDDLKSSAIAANSFKDYQFSRLDARQQKMLDLKGRLALLAIAAKGSKVGGLETPKMNQLMTQNRNYYNQLWSSYYQMNNVMGTIEDKVPAEKYRKELNLRFQEDARRIAKGQTPSWMAAEEVDQALDTEVEDQNQQMIDDFINSSLGGE